VLAPLPVQELAGQSAPGSTFLLPEGFILRNHQVRLHIVQERANPLFWKLLKRFGTFAPAAMLINTSFNKSGESLVAKPADAFCSHFCSGIDALVIGNLFLSRIPFQLWPSRTS
jgi:Carbamoyltransferase C-terminus